MFHSNTCNGISNLKVFIFSRPMFLPDPKDGSLYAFGSGLEGLKKLPFTIPELVTAAPCRSSDGILYTGGYSTGGLGKTVVPLFDDIL